jgi:hypothetical protein
MIKRTNTLAPRAIQIALVLILTVLTPAIARAQSLSARQIVERAAQALGGADRIRTLKNITLNGYGQYAYMFGGGNITASVDAPMKFQAANDLRRIVDFEHERFAALERRYYQFPFAGFDGHDYHLGTEVLDGDIAYDVAPGGKASRIYRWQEDAHQIDGVHMRRMWSITNPVSAIRSALDPANQVTIARQDARLWVLSVILKRGDRFTLAIDRASDRPVWVRWINPMTNFGQLTLTTRYTGYTPHAGLLMPLGYKTSFDWRNIPYLTVFVDSYEVDGKIADLAAPTDVRAAREPGPPAFDVAATPVAKGIWRLSTGTTVFEFADHLTLFELNGSQERAIASIDFAKKMVPGKPVTQLIVSHGHLDHAPGVRPAVAEGMTIISRRGNEGILREQVQHAAPNYPDKLARNPKPFKFIPVDDHLRLSDRTMTVDVYWARDNIHMADAVFAYAPAQRVIAEGDIATAARDFQWWPDNYMDNIEYYKLDPLYLSPVHSVWPEHPGVLTQDQVIELIKFGVKNARDRCAAELAKNNYFPGCPVESKRY